MARQQKQQKVQNVRLPFIGSMTNRDYTSTKDQRFINIFPETRKVEAIESTKIFLNKRPGLTEHRDFGTGEGRGMNYFNNKFYVVVGNTVYEDAVTPVAKITLTTSTGQCGTIVCNSASIGDYLFICDGVEGWVIKTDGTATKITDVDFPTPHIPTPTFIDGYVILAKGSDVYNCVLDDPFSWDPSNYLTAEMFPDPIVALARQNNQVVVLGGSSIEFFYDAANASGSPLSRNDSTVIQMGCASPHCIYQAEQTLIYIGQSDSGGRAVWLISGFQPKRVSDEYIDRILDAETSLSNAHGYGLRTMGHLFFVINLPGSNRTLVYDVEEKLWHEWSSSTDGNTHNVFCCNHMADSLTGSAYTLHKDNGKVYKLDTTNTQDDIHSIVVDIITNRYDMDTINRKFMHNYRIIGDRYSSNSIDLRWTDDDYQTWSNWKTISLSDDFPNFSRLGVFRRRAFQVRHTQAQPLRMESFEVTYSEGDY